MGNYVVQSLSVSSIQRSLFIKFPIEIMCSSKCSSQFFFYKIHSVISNSTFHNVNVKKKHVFEDEGIEENTQKLLSCNVHAVILFPKKVKELCGDILAIIGKKKIKKRLFLVDIVFHSESSTVKSLMNLSNFIRKDISLNKISR